MTMPESPIDAAPSGMSDDDLDARWARDERARKAVAAGADVSALDRALYTALAHARTPSLTTDFAANVATTAERLAEARRSIARFRRFSLRLFALLYVPAIVAALWWFAADLRALWLRPTFDERAPLLWVGVVAALWSVGIVVERWRARRAFSPEG
ncbi:MAG: hypothetical protein E6Q50_00760 [Lysobacter sp.]|nr:MAG: hypothetical protein E6Q50_00760 [Lysobacter sp.]